MSKKTDLLSNAERSVKALLLKSKDASLDEQVDTIRAVTAFLMVKHRIAPDKDEDDWLSDAQRKLRGTDDTAKPDRPKAKRGTSSAYLAASRAAADAAAERARVSVNGEASHSYDVTPTGFTPADAEDEND